MKRRVFLYSSVLLTGSQMLIGCVKSNALETVSSPGSGKKANSPAQNITVGFSQIGAESGWHTAIIESIKSEATKRGIDLRFADTRKKRA